MPRFWPPKSTQSCHAVAATLIANLPVLVTFMANPFELARCWKICFKSPPMDADRSRPEAPLRAHTDLPASVPCLMETRLSQCGLWSWNRQVLDARNSWLANRKGCCLAALISAQLFRFTCAVVQPAPVLARGWGAPQMQNGFARIGGRWSRKKKSLPRLLTSAFPAMKCTDFGTCFLDYRWLPLHLPTAVATPQRAGPFRLPKQAIDLGPARRNNDPSGRAREPSPYPAKRRW